TLSRASSRGTARPTTVRRSAAMTRLGAAHSPRGIEDGFEDPLVARAAADVAAHVVLHLVGRRLRIVGEQRHRRHDHAAGAEAALERAVLDERLLDRMEILAAREALDRTDASAARLEREDGTGTDRTIVQQDGAGATHLDVAGLLHAQQAEPVAQALDQRLVRRHGQVVLVAVDDHGHRDLSHRRALPSIAASAWSQARRRSTPTRCSLYSAEPC